MLLADYTFIDALWTMIVFFAWVMWFWLVISMLTDVFRRHDISGGAKALWTVFIIFLPLLGVLIYLISQGKGMAERRLGEAQAALAQCDAHVREVAGGGGAGAAAEIEKAKQLLDSGAITQAEFDALKAKALG